MRQYELAIRIAQVHHLVDERKYKKALAVIQTLDMRQVRSLSDLKVFAEVYTKTEQYEAAKATYLRIYRRSRTRRVLYRLIYLSIRTNALDDAEAYYHEFVRMNPNARDALILRYRIDKAAGVPIGQLIEILQELKQEEYIEEWAYELAKLYHRAGRREECLEECEDILLWFGTGEIVERAKILIDHLKEKDPIPYYDDKDFTIPKKEEPNPDDTGSLPDLNEFIKERKAQRKEERLAEKAARKAQAYEEEYEDGNEEDYDEENEDDLVAFDKEEAFDKDDLEEELNASDAKRKKEQEKAAEKTSEEGRKKNVTQDDTFIDDYEEDDFEQDGIDFSQKAKDGIQKLSGLLKLGKKEEETPKEKEAVAAEEIKEEKEQPKTNKPVYIPHSQSGTGITQDLAKEISAIYEMEHREQLKERAVTVINEVPNIATNVVDRMTQAIQKTAGRGYIPIDIEEIHGKEKEKDIASDEFAKTKEVLIKEEVTKEFVIVEDKPKASDKSMEEAPKVKDSLMEALDAEVEQYYEKKNQEVKEVAADKVEEAVTDKEEAYAEETAVNEEERTVEEITIKEEEKAVEEEIAVNEEEKTVREETAVNEEERTVEEEITIKEEEKAVEEEIAAKEEEKAVEEETTVKEEEKAVEEIAVNEEEKAVEEEIAVNEDEKTVKEKTAANEDERTVEEETAVNEEEKTVEEEIAVSVDKRTAGEETIVNEEESEEESAVTEEISGVIGESESQKSEAEILKDLLEEEIQDPENEQPDTSEEAAEEEDIRKSAALENYHAPEIPVVETDYMEMPEISYEDLPTTRALQQSFKNVLKLIAGELDPSHFVLMGEGAERIVGVSKQIVRVMKETGYLSQGRIAKIHAEQLNKMDLITFRSQLKGNCLLIEGAADLLFPTITKVFSIMEEYYGDFVVILADEGTTLDQLFRFVPALARKFKYIIDISKYTEEDYK